MKLIPQKNHCGCLPASLFMLNDNNDYSKIKNFCKKHFGYKPSKHKGSDIDTETVCNVLAKLGFDTYIRCNIKSVTLATKFNKALILLHDGGSGHAIAWDGYKCFDPDHDKTYSVVAINRLYKPNLTCNVIVFKTHMIGRIRSALIKPFYDLLEIIGVAEQDRRRS